MTIKSYDELTSLEIDTLREIGSIGTGNAATALSQILKREIRITLKIMNKKTKSVMTVQ